MLFFSSNQSFIFCKKAINYSCYADKKNLPLNNRNFLPSIQLFPRIKRNFCARKKYQQQEIRVLLLTILERLRTTKKKLFMKWLVRWVYGTSSTWFFNGVSSGRNWSNKVWKVVGKSFTLFVILGWVGEVGGWLGWGRGGSGLERAQIF